MLARSIIYLHDWLTVFSFASAFLFLIWLIGALSFMSIS
jgi:hypothetical protein